MDIKAYCHHKDVKELLCQHNSKRLAIALIASLSIHLLLTFCLVIQEAPQSYSMSGTTLEARVISSTSSSIAEQDALNVDDASIVEAEPSGYFEESVLTAVRKARFALAQRFGKSVRSRVLIAVKFDGQVSDKENDN